RAAGFYESIAERLHAVPGVARAALSTHLPLEWINNGERLFVEGVEQGAVRFKRVDPGYFEAFDIPFAAGRGISRRDRGGARRVIVINEALARRLVDVAGMKDAVGQTVNLTCPAYAEEDSIKAPFEIVGVIRSERVDVPWQPDPPVVYVPLAQVPSRGVKLVVRTEPDAASIMPSIREAVGQVDSNLPLGDVATMSQVQARTLSAASRPASVIGAFAFVASLLAALGLYGVLAHAVTLQRGEIGIRMALGAQPRNVLSQVLRSAGSMVAAGLVLGLIGAFALTRVLESLLFQVSPVDPLALAMACVSMIAVGLLAAFVPACRAAGVDPVTVLREQG
ncbi:MAG: FtsX-like permease family protein, partial [Luteitalea sp.]|nr:FtsX-like permease family protein [Luteitalea sp.]